jgi:hypothetical protein
MHGPPRAPVRRANLGPPGAGPSNPTITYDADALKLRTPNHKFSPGGSGLYRSCARFIDMLSDMRRMGRVSEHGSYHAMSRQMQVFCAIKLLYSRTRQKGQRV